MSRTDIYQFVQRAREDTLGAGNVDDISAMLRGNISAGYSYTRPKSHTHDVHAYRTEDSVLWSHHRVKDDVKLFVEKALHLHDGGHTSRSPSAELTPKPELPFV